MVQAPAVIKLFVVVYRGISAASSVKICSSAMYDLFLFKKLVDCTRAPGYDLSLFGSELHI
jgi:hypothetical protein